jgi:hypothetical protein
MISFMDPTLSDFPVYSPYNWKVLMMSTSHLVIVDDAPQVSAAKSGNIYIASIGFVVRTSSTSG